ncbi:MULTISPECIES: ricin-type beta-trefoil lectin domain protein [Streptomyces]|uniref:Ricin B lectin domain-containing protein n=1 Tax=Streptomyces luteosporeus TaxID=173856 RepID=A0ABP6G8V2_9ACTN
MKRKNLLRGIVGASAAATICLATATAASANSWVTWTNTQTGKCLGYNQQTYYAAMVNCGSQSWYDYKVGSNVYQERNSAGSGARCLDSNKRGSVYVGPCESGNKNQMWFQVKMPGLGWTLTNMATGMCLQSAPNPGFVMTGDCNTHNDYIYWI